MKKMLSMVLIALLSVSCVTKVWFDSSVEGAEVYLDGQKMGETPFVAEVSAYAWYDPYVVVKKEGYKDLKAPLKLTPRVGNLVAGILFLPSVVIGLPCLLTCYGPDKRQYFDLEENKVE